MTKAEIVNKISSNLGLEKNEVLATVENFMDEVKDSLSQGENVYLRGFGSFIVKIKPMINDAALIMKINLRSLAIPAAAIPANQPKA